MPKPGHPYGKMTPMRERFVQEYLKNPHIAEAYVAAGFSATKKRIAEVEGGKLLRVPCIADAIAEGMQRKAKAADIDADWVLRRLKEEAEADISDLYDDEGNILPIKQWPKIWRTGLVAGIDINKLMMGDEQEVKVVKLKLADRQKTIDQIGRHVDVQAFRDRVGVEVTDGMGDRIRKARDRKKRIEENRK